MALVTFEVNPVLTGIYIDPINKRLILNGALISVEQEKTVLRQFSEDVTEYVTPEEATALLGIVARAQGWIESKVS